MNALIGFALVCFWAYGRLSSLIPKNEKGLRALNSVLAGLLAVYIGQLLVGIIK